MSASSNSSSPIEQVNVDKVCGKCEKIKPIQEFSVKNGGRNTKCKECVRAYFKKYYAANKEYIKKKTQKNRARCVTCNYLAYYCETGGIQSYCSKHKTSTAVSINSPQARKPKPIPKGLEAKEWFEKYRDGKPCEHCGNDNPLLLDCHHVDRSTKIARVSRLVSRGNLQYVKNEVEKCIFLCSNCHKNVTQDEINSYRSRFVRDGLLPDISNLYYSTQMIMINFLRDKTCCICGESDMRCLECDHIEPTTKVANISDLVYKGGRSVVALERELEKCQVMCSNCHRIKTQNDKMEKKFDSRTPSKRKYDALVAEVRQNAQQE